jgi:hypothetical protein
VAHLSARGTDGRQWLCRQSEGGSQGGVDIALTHLLGVEMHKKMNMSRKIKTSSNLGRRGLFTILLYVVSFKITSLHKYIIILCLNKNRSAQ